jgi:hypothetical protein
MQKKIFFSLIISFLAFTLSAQVTLKGRIVNDQTNIGISNCLIHFKDKETQTTTDTEGNFSIKLSLLDLLSIGNTLEISANSACPLNLTITDLQEFAQKNNVVILEKNIALSPKVPNKTCFVRTVSYKMYAPKATIILRPLSPVIRWESPSEEITVTDNPTITLKACIESITAPQEIKVYIDNQPYTQRDFIIKPANKNKQECEYVFNSKIELSTRNKPVWITLEVRNTVTTSRSSRSIEVRQAAHQQQTYVNSPISTPSVPPSVTGVSGRKTALILGNSSYSWGGSLTNPKNDADDIGQALRDLGFEVMSYKDVNLRTFNDALDEFGRRMNGADVALFFYAGHGVQLEGENYLIPTDARLQSSGEVKYECVPVGKLLAKMEGARTKTNILLLDACRNNPFERSWSRSVNGNGLKAMDAPTGTFIGFATAPNTTASDGDGRNGTYTSAILQHIKTPNLTLDQIFNRVNKAVQDYSKGRQIPWKASSLSDDFYFKIKN